jgi:hypothetical protein
MLMWDQYILQKNCAGSHSALRCIWGTKRRCTIFLACVGPLWIPQKCFGTTYHKLVFLHPLVSAGHVVHSGTSATQNINAQCFMLGWDLCGFHKKRVGTSYIELLFLHLVAYAGHVVHPGRETLMHYFSSLCVTGTDSTKSELGHVTPNFYFAPGCICGSRSALRCV